MFTVDIVGRDRTIKVSGGTLASACAAVGLPLDLVCGGLGTCGKCAVNIETSDGRREVLACRTEVDRDMKVWLRDEQITRSASILTDARAMREIPLSPSLTKESAHISSIIPDHCGYFVSCGELGAMRRFAEIVSSGAYEEITTVKCGGSLIDVRPGAVDARLYGGAVDIGTTSVVLYVRDLASGRLLCVESELNRQIARGADVISRIKYAQSSPEALLEMNKEIVDTINSLISRAKQKLPHLAEDMHHMVLCGNSTMQHLFLRMSPRYLGESPFAGITSGAVRATAGELGLNIPNSAVVDFLPLIGGFIGSDTTAALLTLPMDGRTYLLIDLGTNGEIALGDGTRYMAASTACGPALEGGSLECGMRGCGGAIDRVRFADDDVDLHVIDGGEPIGICGSGIVDAVAEMLRSGIIDGTGRMMTRAEYEAARPGNRLAERIVECGAEGRRFVLSDGECEVYISMKDIRQIQMAKSAIYSGCAALIHKYGITPDDIDSLVIAGAFGSYIDIDNALFIGLLPKADRGKICAIGNGAGSGAQMCLLNKDELERASSLAKRVEHLELADDPTFSEQYILNMDLA